jgi:hypothetical protein
MKRSIRVLLLLAGAWMAGAQAQTLYRCGKTYQDRPCAAGQAGKAMGSAASSAPVPRASGTVPPECVQMGKDSLKIVWAREGGASLERLLEEAVSEAQKRLIRDAYRRGGAASHVQAAVEADCVVARAKAEEDEAIALAAALKAKREGRFPSAEPAPAAGYGDPAAAARAGAEQAAYKAEEKKRLCARLDSDMDSLVAAERRGGSAQAMDSLSAQRRALRDRVSRAGC